MYSRIKYHREFLSLFLEKSKILIYFVKFQRLEEWKADLEYVLVELKELQQRLINNCLLRTSDVENALNVSMDISESTKMLAQAVIDSGLFCFN